MTMNDEQPRLHAALGKVADSFEPPDFDALCERAVRHGRRTIVRRRAFGAGIGVLALAGVAVGAVGAVNTSHPARGLGGTVPVVTVSNGDLAAYMAKNLLALLPAGITLIEDGGPPVTGKGLVMGPSSGDWQVSATVFAMYQGKKTTFDLAVVQQSLDRLCMTQVSADVYTCTSTTLDGHTLLAEKTSDDGAGDGTAANWTYTWDVGEGRSVELSAGRELSRSLVATVLTAPAWTSVLGALPGYVDCPTFEQVRADDAVVWKCPTTGRTYPTVPSDVYLYPSS